MSTSAYPSDPDRTAELDVHIRDVEERPGLSAPVATKYRQLERWLANVLGTNDEDIRTVWMDTAGAFTSRRGTIASAAPRVCVILVGEGLQRIAERAEALLTGRTECILLCVKESERWSVARIVSTDGSELSSLSAELFGVPESHRRGLLIEPSSASEPLGATLSELLPRPSFTPEDLELLSRYRESTRWSDVPTSDQDAYEDIRQRLKALASLVQAETDPTLPMAAHSSMRNVRGYAAKDMWCCIFPERASNKSYALQVALIISPTGAELCLCLGSGAAMERVEEHKEANLASFRELQEHLRELPESGRKVLEELQSRGWNLRKAWRKAPGTTDFEQVDEWIQHATSPGGGGASISRNLTPDELAAMGDGIVDEVVRLAHATFDVFAFAYEMQPPVTFDLETIVAECGKSLRLPQDVYENVWAAIESGKHVILTGPPGTGKTTLAQMVADIAARSRRSAGWVLTTATSDWTTYETIGGLRPTQEGLEFEEGHFLAAIRERKWLVIDELNRSNFDRAFGQLFTALSGQPVVLPYHRPDRDERLTIVPETKDGFLNLGGDQLVIPKSWRVLATINVFDKSLLFEMSYALMRRFAFVDVPSPTDEDFEQLIDDAATDESGVRDDFAAEVARSLLEVRTVKDIGPASYMDLTRFVRRLREADASIDPAALRWRAFFSYLLPQFEGIDERDGRRLHTVLAGLVGPAHQKDLKQTLATVLGLSAFAVAPPDRSADEGEELE